MKAPKNYLMLMLAASSIALFSACENDAYNSEKAEAENTKDLIAPSDFDWKMTQTATCAITSPVNTVVSVYSDADCTDKSLVAENIGLTANETKEIPLDIPSYKSAIYVQYSTADGAKVIEGKISSTATRNSTEKIVLVLPDAKAVDSSDITLTHFYYPGKSTQGTLMFEDLYPELGDYDFNDFVIGYNVDAFVSIGNKKESHDGFTMTFTIRAIGGKLPYRPALRLKGFTMKYLEGAKITFDTSRTGISMELVKGRSDEEDVIFVINGTGSLRKGGFYNTDPESSVDTDLPVVTCKVIKNNQGNYPFYLMYNNIASNLPAMFDFFLQNTSDKNEIHFKGFQPTDMSNMDPSTEFMHEGRKLVWAIAVPEEIKYPKERVDILDIYKGNFQSWVSTGGGNHADWYKKAVNPTGLFN